MTWRDRLQPASFRSVAFKVRSHSAGGGGRRVHEHEYPGRDEPFAEDLGRKSRTFSFDAYVIGPDYDRDRNALIDACDAAGSATLSHPYLGDLDVMCTACVPRENNKEGGMARFQLTFVDAGRNRFPIVAADTQAQSLIAADSADKDFTDIFETSFTTDNVPAFVAEDGLVMVAGAAGRFADIAPSLSDQAGEINAAAASLGSQAISNVRDAIGLAQKAKATFDAVSAASNPTAIVAAAKRVSDFAGSLPAVPSTTATRQIQAGNRTAFTGLIRRLSFSTEARGLSAMSFVDRASAIASRDGFAERVDVELQAASAAGDSIGVRALRKLSSVVLKDLTSRAPRLPRLVGITLPAAAPALVTAYKLYGAAAKVADIVQRNAVTNPLFVPGGQELEVLTDD